MKIRLFTTVLFTLGAVAAHGQEIRQEPLTVGDARYRLTGVDGSFTAHPDGTQPQGLTWDQSLARCDALVAAIIARATPAGRKAPFVLERTVPQPQGQNWVEYSQRHQGYRILGGGARIGLDAGGRITFAGVQYESEEFPTFKPRPLAILAWNARWAVPRWTTGPAMQAELMIDPMGDAPARLVYLVVYPVREWGHESGWQVSVDAVTGKVVSSRTTTVNAAAAAR